MKCHSCHKQWIPVPQYKDARTIFYEKTGREPHNNQSINPRWDKSLSYEDKVLMDVVRELRHG